MNGSPDLPRLLRAFFYEWATHQRNLSPHTIRSYRDTWRLFLRFAAEHYHRPVTKLCLEDLTDKIVLDFLDHGERVRRGSVGTRNCRLAALRAFFAFLAAREPSTVAQCGAVLHVPTKRAARPSLCYLDANEVEAILAQPDRRTLEGQRDHALLSLLYNTGARIQEALDVCPRAIRFAAPATVRLFGKGRKERICPLCAYSGSSRTRFPAQRGHRFQQHVDRVVARSWTDLGTAQNRVHDAVLAWWARSATAMIQ